MSFTKRDYEVVARIIAETRTRYWSTNGAGAACDIQRAMSEHFADTNPNFDAARFARACEPKGGAK